MPFAAALLLASLAQTSPVLRTDFAGGQGAWNVSGAQATETPDGLRIRVAGATANPWDASLQAPIPTGFAKGAKIRLRFTASSPDRAAIAAYVERAAEPYDKFAETSVTLTPEPKEYTAEGTVAEPLPNGGAHITFHLGRGAGTILFRSVALEASGTVNVASGRGDLFRWEDLANLNPGGAHPPKLAPGPDPNTLKLVFDNPGNSWEAQIGRPSLAAVNAGDAVRMTFRARTEGEGTLIPVFEQAADPNAKIIMQAVGTDRDWRTYEITRQSTKSYAKGETQAKLFFSGTGTAYISDLRVENLGPIAGPFGVNDKLGPFTRKRDEALLSQARANIEEIRKGKLDLTVLGANGKPLANANVRVTLARPAFRWGTAVTAALINAEAAEGMKYREVLAREFNAVVFENDLKWNGGTAPPAADTLRALDWLRAHNFDVRGHNLVWGSDQYLPADLKAAPVPEKWPLIAKHIEAYVNATKGKVYVWDVVNEAVTNTALWEQIGWEKFAESYKLAKKADPNALLAYNEYNIYNADHRRTAIARVKLLQSMGAPVDIFGDQSHFGNPEPSARAIWDGWNEVAKETGLPIELTEYDFGSLDDAMYGDQIEDTMTLAFGNPNIRAFVMWGFWEGAHWRASEGGAIVRKDFSYREPMKRYHRLVHETWTTDAVVKTDASGTVSLPAFYGTYRITSGGKTATAEHPRPARTGPGGMNRVTVTLK